MQLNYSNLTNQVLTISSDVSGGTLSNLNNCTLAFTNGAKVTGSVIVQNCNGLIVTGLNANVPNPSGTVGVFSLRGANSGLKISGASVISSSLIDCSTTGVTYPTIALKDSVIDGLTMDKAQQIIVGSFGSVLSNIVDNLTITNVKVTNLRMCDVSNGTGMFILVRGNGMYRLNCHDWNVSIPTAFAYTDCGLFQICGNVTAYNIYLNGGWEWLARVSGVSLGSTVQDSWFYNCIKLNTNKYGLVDFRVEAGNLIAGKTTGSGVHILDNTMGNCTDYNDASHQNPYCTPFVIFYPQDGGPWTNEVRGNLGFNMPSFMSNCGGGTSGIVNFGGVKFSSSNNAYYPTYSQAGLQDDVKCVPAAGSPVIGKGFASGLITVDIWNVLRLVPTSIGAAEYPGGGPVPPPINQLPTANAGPDQNIATSSTVLTGTGSDPDGTITSYAWKQKSGPNNSVITPAATPGVANVTGLVNGVYVFGLVVTDNSGGVSPESDVTVTVNIPPPVVKTIKNVVTNTATNQATFTYNDGSTKVYSSIKSSSVKSADALGNLTVTLTTLSNVSTTYP